jgi:UDP-glucose 4-epimerase
MRALVTGGSGFIGSHIVDRLRESGLEVRVFDMVLPGNRQDIEYYHGSLLDLESLQMAMNGVDVIFHLAAIADVSDVFKDPRRSEAINVRGTFNVLEAARWAAIDRIVYASTTWVYSDTDVETVDEDTPLHAPSHLYTATKVAAEYYCRSYASLYGLKTTIVRYGIPYGPRARAAGVIPIFVRKALAGEPLTIAGDGQQYRKFVYVEDLARGTVLAMKPVGANRIYNLDGKEVVTILDIAKTVQELVGDTEIVFTEGRPGDFSGREVSSQRAKDELGWEPKVSFKEGVRQYIEWYKEAARQVEIENSAVDIQLI